MKKTIGILGGMGPLATADLFQKIISLTAAAGDSGHIRIYIDNNPAIPDRTAAILGRGPDPLPAMRDSLRKLESCGADCIVMPCNTAHFFLPRLQGLTDIPFLSMLEAAARAGGTRFPGRSAAVLATQGTLSAGLYQDVLEREGIPYLLPDAGEQDALMRVIYGGVKAGTPPESWRADLLPVLEALSARGAEYFILGCTELPLAFRLLGLPQSVLDPTEELARAAVRFCGYPLKS